jgi:hypothetical protein
MNRLLSGFLCLCWTLITFSYVAADIGSNKLLHVRGIEAFYAFPFLAGCLTFLYLTRSLPDGGWLRHPLVRVAVVSALWLFVWISPGLYRSTQIACVDIDPVLIESRVWARLQSSVDFKMTRITDAKGSHICFPKGPGRKEQIEAFLSLEKR